MTSLKVQRTRLPARLQCASTQNAAPVGPRSSIVPLSGPGELSIRANDSRPADPAAPGGVKSSSEVAARPAKPVAAAKRELAQSRVPVPSLSASRSRLCATKASSRSAGSAAGSGSYAASLMRAGC